MTDAELEKLMKQAQAPSWEPGYWEEFPIKVVKRLKDKSAARDHVEKELINVQALWRDMLRMRLGITLGAAALVLVFTLVVWRAREAPPSRAQSQAMLKYVSELETLFPNQLRALIIDQNGPRVELSEKGNLPRSTPIYLRICKGRDCEKVITFSGQEISIHGEKCEVLADVSGKILLMGERSVWSSAQPDLIRWPYRIEAWPLENSF